VATTRKKMAGACGRVGIVCGWTCVRQTVERRS